MFTTEAADEPLFVKLSTVMLLVAPPSAALAEPVTPPPASAAPHPSHRHSEDVPSFPVGPKRRPTGPGPAAEPPPSGTSRNPSGLTARRTVPLVMHAAGKHARRTAVVSGSSSVSGSGSVGAADRTVATFARSAEAPGAVTTIWITAVSPGAIDPSAQVTVPAFAVQSLAGSAATNVVPAGSVSTSVTPVAVEGPSFETTSV